ncbi:hypothetical protein HNR23_000718 [Nocardiopsis mwathae]|uniref:Putative Flp pilus-assembly TadG-like N-terminal domain-containing protein n=1 Tax=Nocardiopsis mwathae TaxID=1472723 RepID=A0A7X0D3X6_9ACTN|nr:pilus assembly protein TadG-related protein [Nocardiopsis mwathae]MBB6170658.1 hypothetical protein [Nocardiopsis mwathae]
MVFKSAKPDEQGQASLFLLVALSLALLSLTVLYVRLGFANDLRNRAQQAADAAALAAAGQAADDAARTLANHRLPYGGLYSPAGGRERAESYAKANGSILEDIRASDNGTGNTGNIIRVEVRSAQCQRELEEGGSRHWNDSPCDGTESEEGDGISLHSGNADAIAEVTVPDCSYIFHPDIENFSIIGVSCNGQSIRGYEHARRMIEVKLTNKEGKYLYKPATRNNDDG